jgi:hypothetical protein
MRWTGWPLVPLHPAGGQRAQRPPTGSPFEPIGRPRRDTGSIDSRFGPFGKREDCSVGCSLYVRISVHGSVGQEWADAAPQPGSFVPRSGGSETFDPDPRNPSPPGVLLESLANRGRRACASAGGGPLPEPARTGTVAGPTAPGGYSRKVAGVYFGEGYNLLQLL